MNKNGWGLRVELVIILLFLICLAIACIGLNRFGLLGENDNPLIKELVDIPVKFVGLGEKETDLIPFDIEKYIYGLFKEF